MPQSPHRLQNDLKYVEWDVKVKPYYIHMHISYMVWKIRNCVVEKYSNNLKSLSTMSIIRSDTWHYRFWRDATKL